MKNILFEKLYDTLCGKKSVVVPVVRLNGVISDGCGGGFRSPLNVSTVEKQLERAFNMPRVTTVALMINSPGGSPVQSERIFRRVRELAKEKNVKVLTFAEDVAASGGYWLMCCGDELYSYPSSIIGSIGVISAGFGFEEAIKKLGIERRVHTQGKNKSILDPFMPLKESDVKIVKEVQEDIFESFKNVVKDRRGKKLKAKDDKVFTGAFWSGAKAVEYGLVDKIGDVREVLKEQFGDDVKIRFIGRRKGLLGGRVGAFVGNEGDGSDAAGIVSSTSSSGSLIDRFCRSLVNAIREAGLWNRMM